MMDVCQG
jgi:hypothetical protein